MGIICNGMGITVNIATVSIALDTTATITPTAIIFTVFPITPYSALFRE